MKKFKKSGAFVLIFVLISMLSVGISCDLQFLKNKLKNLKAYKVTVNYNLTPDQMLAASNYQWCVGDLKKEKLSGNGIKQVRLYIVPIEKELSSGQVFQYLDSLGLKPASFAQLLALAANNPDIEKDGAIVAMGSQWWDFDKYLVSPVLRIDNSNKRGIAIQPISHQYMLEIDWIDWDPGYRFLAYKK